MSVNVQLLLFMLYNRAKTTLSMVVSLLAILMITNNKHYLAVSQPCNPTQPFPTEPLKCVHSSSLFDIPCHKGGNNCGLLMVKQQIIILSDIWRNALDDDGEEEEDGFERLNSLWLYSKVKVVLTDKIIIHIVTQHQ